MNPGEYEIMRAVENDHWWYRGLRDLLTRIALPEHRTMADGGSVLDLGCGTGANMHMLQNLLAPAYLGGFDVADAAVQRARNRVPTADVYQSDLTSPELHRDFYDLILCCDVLYTTGIQPVMDGLQRVISRLRPRGMFLLHLPAFNWLYSQHDAAVHTRHRFSKSEVVRLLDQLGLTTELITYRMFLLFPAVVVARLPSLLRGVTDECAARSDLVLPSRLINATLNGIVRCENAAIEKGLRFPWGSSLIAVGRKP